MRYCLINLTRFGDLLQTQTVVHALKQEGHQVGLVCLDNFAQAAQLLQGLDHLASFPGSLLLGELGRDWRKSLDKLQGWLGAQKKIFPAEQVLNLTPSLGSRLLANALSQGRTLGFALDDHGFGANSNTWATYVQAVSKHRGSSPFNLVDGFRQMAGLGQIPALYQLAEPAMDLVAAQRVFLNQSAAALGLEHQKGFIAFQLGASAAQRQWPIEYFAQLGQEIRRSEGICPVLLGSGEERELAAAYLTLAAGIDLTGKTDLPVLAASLKCCELLVTNDTGTMHLAAGLGVPCLAIFLATAQAWDTGPYREDMCCLEPDLDCHPCDFGQTCGEQGKCQLRIAPWLVRDLIRTWLRAGRWTGVAQKEKAVRIWRTRFEQSSFIDLEALSEEEHSDRTIWIRHQRRFYRRLLDELDNNPFQDSDPAWRSFPLSTPKQRQLAQTLDNAAGLLLLIRQRAALLEMHPSDHGRTSFLASCERMDNLLRDSRDFVPLAYLWRDNLQGLADDWGKLLFFFEKLRASLLVLAQEIAVA